MKPVASRPRIPAEYGEFSSRGAFGWKVLYQDATRWRLE
jgi:hypothetical protein